jgi:hypothetical protein
MCTGCVWTRGSGLEESNPSCIGIPFAAIFGYVVRDIGAHLLEKIESIW